MNGVSETIHMFLYIKMVLPNSITITLLNVKGCLKGDYQRYIQGGMTGYTQDRSECHNGRSYICATSLLIWYSAYVTRAINEKNLRNA